MASVSLLFLDWVGFRIACEAEELITFSQVGRNTPVLSSLYGILVSIQTTEEKEKSEKNIVPE